MLAPVLSELGFSSPTGRGGGEVELGGREDYVMLLDASHWVICL